MNNAILVHTSVRMGREYAENMGWAQVSHRAECDYVYRNKRGELVDIIPNAHDTVVAYPRGTKIYFGPGWEKRYDIKQLRLLLRKNVNHFTRATEGDY
jgi:hypothetical protein